MPVVIEKHKSSRLGCNLFEMIHVLFVVCIFFVTMFGHYYKQGAKIVDVDHLYNICALKPLIFELKTKQKVNQNSLLITEK